MPKETFGGDGDDEEAGEERKKPALDKYTLSPDSNIKDLFWRILGSYAAAKKPGVELNELEQDRFALMRSAVSALSNPDTGHYGLSPRFVATYSMMMMLDAEWKDMFADFLTLSMESRMKIADYVKSGLKKLIAQEKYKSMVYQYLEEMLRNNDSAPVALAYIADINDPVLSAALKKELIIFARGDIGENQRNAIMAISGIKNDSDVLKSLIVLLSHWDKEARMAAAIALDGVENEEVKEAAAKRIESETDDEIKKILKRISK